MVDNVPLQWKIADHIDEKTFAPEISERHLHLDEDAQQGRKP